MITYIEVDGFKTFHNFKAEFGTFVLVAGANGSGKSNLFDVFKLLSRLTEVDLKTAFNEQRGAATELFMQYPNGDMADTMRFLVEMLVDKEIKDRWGGEKTLKYTRLRYELYIKQKKDVKGFDRLYIYSESLTKIATNKDSWTKRHIGNKNIHLWRPKVKEGKRGKPYISTVKERKEKRDITKIQIHQDGKQGGRPVPADVIEQTVLSSVNSVDFPHAFAAKKEMQNWKFLQLNPIKLREPSPRFAPDQLGIDGSNLAAVLHRLKINYEYVIPDISREINNLLPTFTKVDVIENRSTNTFEIKMYLEDGRLFNSSVLSEGTLRLLALCTLKHDELHRGLLCFEEPENGIHPHRIALMIALLQGLTTDFNNTDEADFPLRQLIINTHSPTVVENVYEKLTYFTIIFTYLATLILPEKKLKTKITQVKTVSKILHQISGIDNSTNISEIKNYLNKGF